LETEVNDYDLLRDYLKKQKLPEFVLSFEQIEEILDARCRAPRTVRHGGKRCAARRRRCRSARPVSKPATSRRGRRTGRA
jgi:hypothetical protein